jgi:predicted type IV restriction endonuclease
MVLISFEKVAKSSINLNSESGTHNYVSITRVRGNMDFLDQLQTLSTRIGKQIENIQTEEATKNAFVLPFIQALGYDIFDPTEVIPEYTADVGSKKGEKVDYALLIDNKPTLLFECKCCGSNLEESHASQLRRYFHVTEARIGILSNGVVYRFYSDLDENNIMDDKPFMVINLLDIDEHLLPELKKLSKSTFELDKMLTTANELKYSREIKSILGEELGAPSIDFVRFFVGKVYSGMKTQPILEQFTPIVKKSFSQFINEHISARLKTALAGEETKKEVMPQSPPEDEVENNSGIVTTEEEVEGFNIVKAIIRQHLDPARVCMRDTKSYCGIILDNSNRKTICRLHFNAAQKYLGVITGKEEERIPIADLNEIFLHVDRVTARVTELLEG